MIFFGAINIIKLFPVINKCACIWQFPSTVNMQRLLIFDVVMILNPENEANNTAIPESSFSVDRIKSYVDTENMSTNAQDLMKTMQQFQHVIIITQSPLQTALGQPKTMSGRFQ